MDPEIRVTKTLPDDFEKIYPLLIEFHAPYSKEDWKRIFYYRWDGAQDHVGYHMEHHNEVVGFIGFIFSCQYKNDIRCQFCNITSFIVKPAYRAMTILLLRPLKQYQDVVFTGLAPISESYQLLTKLGFTPFENTYAIFPVINGIFSKNKNFFVDDTESMPGKLDSEQKRIYLDHQKLKCKFLLFSYKNTICFISYHTDNQKHCGIAIKKIHLHYIGNITFFNHHIRKILYYFITQYGVSAAIYVDKRFIQKNNFLLVINRKIMQSKIFYSRKPINALDINHLYSEMVLL